MKADYGCSDIHCVLRDNPVGTNGGCSCLRGLELRDRVVVRRRLLEWRRLQDLLRTIAKGEDDETA